MMRAAVLLTMAWACAAQIDDPGGIGGIGGLVPTQPGVIAPPPSFMLAPAGPIRIPPPPTRPPTRPPARSPAFVLATQRPVIDGDVTIGTGIAPDCSVGHQDCRRCLETSGCRYCNVPVEEISRASCYAIGTAYDCSTAANVPNISDCPTDAPAVAPTRRRIPKTPTYTVAPTVAPTDTSGSGSGTGSGTLTPSGTPSGPSVAPSTLNNDADPSANKDASAGTSWELPVLVILAILLLCVMVGVFLHKRQQTADAKDPSDPTGGGVAPGVAKPKTAMTTNATYQAPFPGDGDYLAGDDLAPVAADGGVATPPAGPADVEYDEGGASLVYAEIDEVDKSNDDGMYAEPVAEPVAPGGGLARKGSFC